jgi:hypothetical protein
MVRYMLGDMVRYTCLVVWLTISMVGFWCSQMGVCEGSATVVFTTRTHILIRSWFSRRVRLWFSPQGRTF